jgi:hypothetical protein
MLASQVLALDPNKIVIYQYDGILGIVKDHSYPFQFEPALSCQLQSGLS